MRKGFVYILISDKDKKSYTGSTNNISRRFEQHCAGQVTATRNRRPLRLIYTEGYPMFAEARQREWYLKTRQGRRELKEIFKKLGL